jgi:IS5 family transposase
VSVCLDQRLRSRGRLHRALDELAETIDRTGRVVKQTRTRPIRKGRIDRPVEFGYKAQVVDNDDGVVLDHTVEPGAAPDEPQLAPAVERIKRRTGRAPRTVTADRGYGEAGVKRDLQDLGVRKVAIPLKGKTSLARRGVEHSRSFRRLVKWRTGSEGHISLPQARLRLGPQPTRWQQGAAIWCGYAVFAHSLVKISALTA